MATMHVLLLLLGAFVALSRGTPAEQSVLVKEGDDVELIPRKAIHTLWNLPHVHTFDFGSRVPGDFVIHTYRVNPFTYLPSPNYYQASVVFELPVGYRWTFTEITIGQLQTVDSSVTIHSISNRAEFSFTYRSLCHCTSLAYDLTLYAIKV